MSKRKLRQTRSLDSAIIRGYGTDTELTADDFDVLGTTCLRSKYASVSSPLSPRSSAESLAASRSPRYRQCPRAPLEKSLSTHFSFDSDSRSAGVKRTATWDLSLLPKNQAQNPGASNTIFSPRKWLQRKPHQANSQSYIVWRSEGHSTLDINVIGCLPCLMTPTVAEHLEVPSTWCREQINIGKREIHATEIVRFLWEAFPQISDEHPCFTAECKIPAAVSKYICC